MPIDFLERLFNKVSWIFRSEEQKRVQRDQEEVRVKAEAKKRAERERERGKKGGWWGQRGRGQCKTFKKLSVVRNGTSAYYKLS